MSRQPDDDGIPNHKRPLPDKPTTALPGSEEKIREMTKRAQQGQWLFHPRDARHTDDGQ